MMKIHRSKKTEASAGPKPAEASALESPSESLHASTVVASISSSLQATWTGHVSDRKASVVLFWPDHTKVYLTFRIPLSIESIEGEPERVASVRSLLTVQNP